VACRWRPGRDIGPKLRGARPYTLMSVTEPQTGVSPDTDADTPQHRYTAELAGEIERAWQETWARQGTFNVANPVGSLAPADGSPVPADKMFVQDMFP
jgi:leucyl-tRNA synthetase